jgi:sugar lactone lactonase YvrE
MVMPEILVNERALNGEGPSWDMENHLLYWVDIPNAKIFVYNPYTNHNRVINLSNHFSSIGTVAPRQSGGLIFAPDRKIAALDLRTEQVTILGEVERNVPENRFNDGKCDPAGRFLVGTMKNNPDGEPGGSLYIMEADLSVRKLLGGLHISNGMGWSPDYTQFYLADSASKVVWAFDYDLKKGAISNRRSAFTLPPGMGVADGLTVDNQGMIWLAMWDGAQITRWNPKTGQYLDIYKFPAKRTSCCVFGGVDLDELYVTSASVGLEEKDHQIYPYNGALMRLRTMYRGMPSFAFAG